MPRGCKRRRDFFPAHNKQREDEGGWCQHLAPLRPRHVSCSRVWLCVLAADHDSPCVPHPGVCLPSGGRQSRFV